MDRSAATYSRRLPDLLSGARILLIPALTIAALAGNGRLVGFGLLLAGATDFLDGYIALPFGGATPRGARLDALADNLLLVSALAWLLWLHPEILTTSWALIATACAVHVASLGTGAPRRRLGSKVAGGCLYAFALVTLLIVSYVTRRLTMDMSALLA